jgi:hypothetical protein
VGAPVQYVPRIAAVAVYLWHGQFLSRGRTCEAIGELFGVPVSPGAVTGMVSRAARLPVAVAACRHVRRTPSQPQQIVTLLEAEKGLGRATTRRALAVAARR